MRYSIYFAIPLMLLLAVVQTAVLPKFTILGASPQLPFLVALTWGLLHSREEGMIWAFVAGLVHGYLFHRAIWEHDSIGVCCCRYSSSAR